MIKFFRSWCEGIIVAVILSIIIETLLPDGNNKKYVKVVIGIYIIFTILNPILGNLDFEFSNIDIDFSENNIETSNITEVYARGIEESLKSSIEEEFDYKIKDLDIKYDENYENIEEINIEISEKSENQEDYSDLKKYISENYGVGDVNIDM